MSSVALCALLGGLSESCQALRLQTKLEQAWMPEVESETSVSYDNSPNSQKKKNQQTYS